MSTGSIFVCLKQDTLPTIINFCPTGMLPTKAVNRSVPISPAEIIEQTHEAYEIGITIAHLHARLENEKPTYLPAVYRDIIEGVRKHCPELIVCASTSGRDFPEFEKRSAVIELEPDMCSLTLSSLNFLRAASVNAPDMINALLDKMLDLGVHPEFECFGMGMINYGKTLLQARNIKRPVYWNLIFGNIAGLQPTLSQMGTAISEIPENHYLALGGIGAAQLPVNATAVANGLGVRIGLEDNIWYNKAQNEKATNITLLKRVHELMQINQQSLYQSRDLPLYNLNHDH